MPEELPQEGPGAPAHPVPRKSEFGGSAGAVVATASSARKHKAEQKGSNLDEWFWGSWLPGQPPGYRRIMEGCVHICAWQK